MHGMDVPQFGNHSALEGHKSNFQFVIKYIYIYIWQGISPIDNVVAEKQFQFCCCCSVAFRAIKPQCHVLSDSQG